MKRSTRGSTGFNRAALRSNLQLYSMMLPVILLVAIFCYCTIPGLIIAFQNYRPGKDFFFGDVDWVGLKHFAKFFEGKYFGRLMKNTILLSLYNLVFGFWTPIAFALLLNELRHMRYKKFVQTASYLPHFVSSVVVAGMAISFLQSDGLINNILGLFGVPATPYIIKPEAFPPIYVLLNIWKSFGFDSILYLSAITAVDTALYESARLDGANRLQQIRYITIPSIMPTISIMLIMAVGRIIGSNTDLILLLYKPSTYVTADVIGTFVYREGIEGGQFSFTTAVDMFSAAINFALVFLANKISNRLTSYGLW